MKLTAAQLKEKFDAAKAKATAICDAAVALDRDLTDEEQASVLALVTEAKGYDDQSRKMRGENDIRAQLESLGFHAPEALTPEERKNLAAGAKGDFRSVADAMLKNDQYGAWLKQVAPEGRFNRELAFTSPAVPFKSLITGASDTSAGALLQNDVQPGLIQFGRRPLTMRQIITQGTTDSDTVEYVQVTSETNNAAPVPEATATSGGSGVKPESGMTLTKITTPVKTIAHWIATTTRAIADAGQMRTLIDNFLRFGLEEKLEDQIAAGDGVGENFTGLKNISGTQDQAWDTDLLTTARRARTKVRVIGRATATAYLLHPNDWERFDLLKDNEARYYFGGPLQLGQPALWGLPVIESESVTEGTGWVGDFRQLVLWDREQATVQVSNSHSDFFIRNLVAILAEMRAAFGCLRPVAFVEMDLTAA